MGQIEYFLNKSENNELHGHFTFPEYITLDYKPLSDITAYELSQVFQIVMGYVSGVYLTRADYDALADGVKRHIPILGEKKKPSASLAGEEKGGAE